MLFWTAIAAAAPSWAPQKGTTIPTRPEHGWRQARVTENVHTYTTAVDSVGRLVVGIHYEDGRLDILRWDGRAEGRVWEDLGSSPRHVKPGVAFAVSTDSDDAVLVALDHATGVTVHRLPGWDLLWRTPPQGRALALALDSPSQTVLAWGPEEGWRQENRLSVATAGAPWKELGAAGAIRRWGPTEGRVSWTGISYDEPHFRIGPTWPVSGREGEPFERFLTRAGSGVEWRDIGGHLSLIAGGSGPELQASSQAAFTSTHYGSEANRVRILRGSEVLAGSGLSSLSLPDTHDLRVFETEPPMVAFTAHDALHIVEWNGEEWWGLSQDAVADRGLGGPGELTAALEMVTPDHIETYLADEDRGSVLLRLTRRGRRWKSDELAPPLPGPGPDPLEHCARGSLLLLTAVQNPASVMAMEPLCDGSFDRVLYVGEPSSGLVARDGELVALPPVPRCDGCTFERGVVLPDGSVIASFLSDSGPARLSRFAGGDWTPESLPRELRTRQVAAIVANGDGVWAAFGSGQHHVVARRDAGGWRPLPDEDHVLGSPEPRRRRFLFGPFRARPVELLVDATSRAHLLRTAWVEDGEESATVAAVITYAVHQDGTWREEPVVSVPGRMHLRSRLALREDGTPLVVFNDGEGVRLLEKREGQWRGLDGTEEGRVWVGAVRAVDVAVDARGQVCVGFTASDVRHERIGVLCYR